MRRLALAMPLLAMLALAGCADASERGTADGQPAPPPSTTTAGPQALPQPLPSAPVPTGSGDAGAHAWVLDTDGSDKEPALALHPTDPRRAAVAWSQDTSIPWVATTTDGGATWRTTSLDIGQCDGAVGPCQRGFDCAVGYGPDGRIFVMFGGNQAPAANYGMTVAQSSDDGLTWEHHRVTGAVEPHAWDGMDMAVVPDTGQLVVAAQSIAHRTLALWTSSDGVAWSPPVPLPVAAAAAATSPDGPQSLVTPQAWPRLTAAPGLVVLATKGFTGGPLRVYTSTDGGESFSAVDAITVMDDSPGGGFIGDAGAPGQDRRTIHAVFAGQQTLWRATSVDGGRSFAEPVADGRVEGRDISWAVHATGADGRLHSLVSHTADGDADWGMTVFTRTPGKEPARLDVVPPTGLGKPTGGGLTATGDEYGGLAVAPDGALWAAWSDARGETPRIVVARLP